VGDAPNSYPGGQGQNMDELDIENAFFSSSAASPNIDVTLTIKNLQAPPTTDTPNAESALWTVYWQQAGTANAPGGSTWWFAQATTTGQGATATATFSDGTFDAGADSYSGRHAATGEFNPGQHGTFVIHVPRTDVGNPADGATLENSFADTAGAFLVLGTGLRYTARGDRAPDSSYGAVYHVAQTCQADLSVVKSGPATGHVGQAITYTIAVHNGGADPAQGVTVTDTLPKNAGFGSVSSSQGTCAPKPKQLTVTCSLGTLANGANATVTLVIKPTTKGNFTDTATVSETGPGDPNSANNSSSVTTSVTP
jgi:uncharacterized repeat protein (TIGR01451 family)